MNTSACSVFIKPSDGLCLSSPSSGPKPSAPGNDVRGLLVGVGVGAAWAVLSAGIRVCTVVPDMANPKPSAGLPLSDASIQKVLMPKIWPDRESIGPPLLPGLMAASVCIISLAKEESYLMADTMPREMVASPDRPRA